MSNNKALSASYDKASHIYHYLNELLDDVAELQNGPVARGELNCAELPAVMRQYKKQCHFTWSSLSLQTEIPVSTLKRIFATPEKANLANFLKVMKQLGLSVGLEQPEK